MIIRIMKHKKSTVRDLGAGGDSPTEGGQGRLL